MNTVLKTWQTLSKYPFGKRLFDLGIRLYIPYTGSMSARVLELRPGFAKVSIRDRRRLRNHLRSVHAIALANLVEYTGNLALACGLPDDARFIVKSIQVDYLKKARGMITGVCDAPIVTNSIKQEITLDVALLNGSQEKVAHGRLLTQTGPVK